MSRRNDNIAGIVFAGNNTRHAMAWSSSRGMTDLGTFGGQNSEAKAVNSAGQVVGFAETASGGRRAFVWAPGHGMLDLNQRLQSAAPGFELESAIAIADDGSIVAAGVGGGVVLLQPSKASGEAIAAHE
jgi:probable HAF family extracellular repeat protein